MGRKRRLSQRRVRPPTSPVSPVAAPPQPDPFARFAPAVSIASALLFLAVYVPTLYPSVAGGDSGELIVAAHQLGVVHPPGYPLFTLLGKLFTWIPAGSVAWRVHLLTAVLGAVAAAILLHATWKLTRSLGAGLLAGGLFAFSPLVWRYAVQAEVFSLNNLVAAVLILLLVSFEAERKESTLLWFCFWFGLGMTNHHTLVFYGAPIGLWMLCRSPRTWLRWPRVLAIPGSAALGLSPYLYLFVSPADGPSTTWGDTGTLAGFFDHLLRRQYGTFRLGTMEAGGSLLERLLAYLVQLPGELLWVAPLLAAVTVGLLLSGKARRALDGRAPTAVALGALLLYLVVFGSLTRISLRDPFWYEVHSRFWQQANLIVCFLSGVGLAWIARRSGRRGPGLAVVFAVAAVVTQAGLHYRGQDHGDDRLVEGFARAMIDRLPHGALLVSKGDLQWNSVRYLQVCEGFRPDIRMLDVELLKAPWMTARVARSVAGVSLPGRVYRAPSKAIGGSYDLADLFDANVGTRAVFSNALERGDASWKEGYTAWPEGLLDRIRPIAEVVDVDRWLARTDRWSAETDLEFPRVLPRGSWEYVARKEFQNVDVRRGTRLLRETVNRSLGDTYLRRAAVLLERAEAIAAEPSASLYLNLGIAYYLLRESDAGAVRKMESAWRRYLDVAPPDALERGLIDQALRNPEAAQIGIGSR